VAIYFQQQTRHVCYEQYWQWITVALPGGDSVYMLGVAAICWSIWKARNGTCFEKKVVNNPIDIVFSACSLVRYWAGLYPKYSQQVTSEGVELMIHTAIKLLGKQSKKRRLLLTDGRLSSDDSEDQRDGAMV
jgi:hypothetical protein